ncbi:hypothetical protein OCA5_pOC16700450 (plasmid) [Afipia carboxidovorans OM5]|uniref:Transmembrane protein n=1 Tax=Afipia carboxidovorans (strain ATCC 49405 / DSM 1227 / KCTC 32145 / OM5) TaxID=504832 RepID=F8C1C8_AFIC5|nr:DUF2933 domain-containing protein [Afipia carboxidovorans]AEI04614.1 hypothetical protein OCA4_pOC167B00450 [Afipia carboxidovorans OM4]AEI08243.1 hypothetical protein OCA5_pOC16700450 [Afipia carboxidovorans OM5]
MESNKNLTNATSDSPVVGSERGWLSGWGGLAACVVAFGGAILMLGGTQSFGKLLPLLFLLPCAIMMFMCMKNMDGNQNDAGSSNIKTSIHKTGSDDGR